MAEQTRGQVQKRPWLRKLMPEQVQGAKNAVVWALERRQNVAQACRMANIGRSTFYQWLQQDLAFAAAVDEARGPFSDGFDGAGPLEAQTTRTLISMLKRLQPGRYGSR